MLDRERAITAIEADRCTCPGCRGELSAEQLSTQGWRHCSVCRCAWKVRRSTGQRYATHIAGRVHAVPAPQQSPRTEEADFGRRP